MKEGGHIWTHPEHDAEPLIYGIPWSIIDSTVFEMPNNIAHCQVYGECNGPHVIHH